MQICSKKEIAQTRSKQEFPEVRIKRQVLDHYSTGISNITCHYNLLSIENLPPQSSNQPPHRIKIDDVDLDFSKVFTENIKKIQNTKIHKEQIQFSQTMFFQSSTTIILLWKQMINFIYHLRKHPVTQNSKTRKYLVSQFLGSIRETLTDCEKPQLKKLIFNES